MSRKNGTAASQEPHRIGRPLPKQQTAREGDLKNLSDDELIAIVNGHHREFVGCFSKAIKDHARVAGQALLLLKSRLKGRNWGGWLKQNFKGSRETARLYMRIARNWALIVELGLDREDITLEELRWVLSDSEGPPPKAKTVNPVAKEEAHNGSAADDITEREDTDTPPPKSYAITVEATEVPWFEETMDELRIAFGTGEASKGDDYSATLKAALRHCRDCKGVYRV